MIERYRYLHVPSFFRAEAAFAIPELYELLEAEGHCYAIRLKANPILEQHVAHLLTRPVGRPPCKPIIWYHSFQHQASSWDHARRVVANVEWHQGELFPRVGFIVTNMYSSAKQVTRFYNQRGMAEQCIKEGKHAVKWTRLSCHAFNANQVRLQLHLLAYNLGNFLRRLALPASVKHWSLTTLREKLIKIGAKVIHRGQYAIFQLAEVAVPRHLYRTILRRIARLREVVLPPSTELILDMVPVAIRRPSHAALGISRPGARGNPENRRRGSPCCCLFHFR